MEDRYGLLSIGRIKHCPVDVQVAILRRTSHELRDLGPAVRDRLEGIFDGRVLNIRMGGSDEEIVLLVLLAAVAREIATLPDARIRMRRMEAHERVLEGLDLRLGEASFFREHFEQIRAAIPGQVT